jgi:hypothetical protein
VFNSHFYYSGRSVFRRGPRFPNYRPPIGQDLRLTIVSADENAADKLDDAGADQRPLIQFATCERATGMLDTASEG